MCLPLTARAVRGHDREHRGQVDVPIMAHATLADVMARSGNGQGSDMKTSGKHEALLTRWSRLKRDAPAKELESPEIAAEEESEAVLLDRLGLPDPDSLSPGDAVAAFMRREVPAFLRQRALRRLWAVNPALSRLDGLVDYDDDYSDRAAVPEILRTTWRVASGFSGHRPLELASRDPSAGQAGPAPSKLPDTGTHETEAPERTAATTEAERRTSPPPSRVNAPDEE